MQAVYLDDAQPAAISHAVRDVLERRGALVTEHVSSRIRFRSLPTGSRWTWDRAGYVGIYQHVGEKEVEVRLRLRARTPWRLLFGVAVADVILTILAFVVNPPGTTWFLLAFVGGLALVVAGLLYVNTLRNVRAMERDLMREFEDEFQKDHVAAQLESAEDRELREAEAALEGEVARLRVQEQRKSEPKPVRRKLNLMPSFGRKKE